MTYNANIPLSTDLISNSQAQIQANFSQLNSQFAIDHVAFNTGSGNGDGTHKKITFDNAPTEPTPAGTVSNIFPLLTNGNQELYFKNSSTEYGGSGKIQLTGPFTAASNGTVFLPGGIILKWGSATITNTQTVNFASAFPNNCWAVVTQPINASAVTVANDYVYVASVALANFSATAVRRTSLAGNTVTFNYIAIGN